MSADPLAILLDKEAIRELVLLYSRGVDRQDFDLLRSLYAADATDDHDRHFNGSAGDYVDFLQRSLPHVHTSGHYVCNHLVSVDGDVGEGEVYAIAWHIIPDGKGGFVEDLGGVRYVDRYRREDGRWLFASRVVRFDFRTMRPMQAPDHAPVRLDDPGITGLASRLFARGSRQ